MKKIILLLAVVFACLSTQAQTDSVALGKLQRFVRTIEVFNRIVPQEKVYLHFDNTSYVLGDTLWFKAYVVNASDFLPDTLSGVLYVELLNEKGKVLETKKLKIDNGQCHGEFYLDDVNVEYMAGFFEIRAYTKAMLNFGAETAFSRVFPVFNQAHEDGQYTQNDIKADLYLNDNLGIKIPLKNLRPTPVKKSNVNIDFYPEGGNLITGLTSIVAFKVTDDKGRPLNADLQILNPQGEAVSSASAEHAGMGSFAYTPDGSRNRAKVILDNKKYAFDLPESKPTGYVLQARHFSNTIIVQIEKSSQTPQSLLGLSILCRGEVLFFQAIDSLNESRILKIPYKALGNGINQLTLFDTKGEIFAERQVFIMPDEQQQLSLEAVPNKTIYEPDDLIQIDFSTVGKDLVKEAVFSVSVRDKEAMIQSNRENIFTNLLLSSDLKGFIENPEDYFRSENQNIQTHNLDLLMMVQGWKRYEWQTMAGIKPFKPSYNREKQIIINGQVVGGKNIDLLVSMVQDKQRQDGETKTGSKGEFYIYPAGDLYGTWTVNLRSEGLTDANTKIRLDRWFSPALRNYAVNEMAWKNSNGLELTKEEMDDDSIIKEIKPDNDSINRLFRIKDVVVTAKTGKQKWKEYIHPVGQEIDKDIDMGGKIPYNVHDYLLAEDPLYCFGKFGKRVDPSKGEFDITVSFYSVVIDRGVVDTTSTFTQSDPIYKTKKSISTVYNIGGKDIDGRDIYEGGYTFYYGIPNEANFFHFDEGKMDAFDRITYKTGKRAYDVSVKELTAKRVIQDVQKIVISGEMQRHAGENITQQDLFVPIYIYPYTDSSMREIQGVRSTPFDGFSAPADYFRDHIAADGIYHPGKFTHNRTLYWNPDVTTDAQGKASIRFYNNNFCKKISVSAEGITTDGVPVAVQ
ncbi:MAG: hypothetical protein FWD66_09465 [Paludibacter sp.]|nr:hypothetical protein [Paludibacter sp.]